MAPALRLALFEPDIPQNTAAVLRTCSCLGVACEVIGPCGFVFGDQQMRRAGMDYLDHLVLTRHVDWHAFQAAYPGQRRILMTTKAAQPYTEHAFLCGDILIIGRESAGVPDFVHDAALSAANVDEEGGQAHGLLLRSVAVLLPVFIPQHFQEALRDAIRGHDR